MELTGERFRAVIAEEDYIVGWRTIPIRADHGGYTKYTRGFLNDDECINYVLSGELDKVAGPYLFHAFIRRPDGSQKDLVIFGQTVVSSNRDDPAHPTPPI